MNGFRVLMYEFVSERSFGNIPTATFSAEGISVLAPLCPRKRGRGILFRLVVQCLLPVLIASTVLDAFHSPALFAQSATDQKTVLAETSLALVPQDAAFYAASLNMRSAWDEFLKGNFVTRLRNVPFAQKLEAEFYEQWAAPQGPLLQVKSQLQNQNVRDLIELVSDMNSQESFIYGGHDWCEFIDGMMAFYNDVYAASVDGPDSVREFFMDLDPIYVDAISIPTTVVGFRLSDDKIARTQLDALEGLLRLGGGQVPELQPVLKKLTRKDYADGQMLSFEFTADLIPVGAIEDEEGREIAEKLISTFKGRKLTISLGVRAHVLVLAIGENQSILDSLGDGPSLLDHERLELIVEETPANLRSVSYLSKEWRQSQWDANYGSYFQRLFSQFAGAIQSVENDDIDVEEWQDSILDDSEYLDERIAEFAPEFDAVVSWSFASEVGREGYAYDWTENVLLENASPLSVLRHAGSSPLFLMAVKQQVMPAVGELIEAILDRAPDHIQNFIVLAEQDDEQQKVALRLLDQGWPLLEDAYQIIRESILPSLDDRESLVSLAAKWTTTQLTDEMPAASQPLPLPEFAGVIKLRDRDQFLSGCKEMYDLFDQLTDLVRDVSPDAIPVNYKVPRPQMDELEGATRFYYSEFRLPISGFEPQVIVSNDVVIYGYSDRQVRDLLEAKPLTSRPAWLTPDMSVASVGFVDFAGIVAAIRPWLNYGLEISIGDLDAPLAEDRGPVPSGNDVLQMWDCLTALGKAATTTVIDDEGVTIVRWVWVGE